MQSENNCDGEYLLSLLQHKSTVQTDINTQLARRPQPFLQFDSNGLSVKYIGKGLLLSLLLKSVQANQPASRDSFVYYYEVKIENIGQRGDMYAGFADSDFPSNKHPGQTRKSIGYRNDGKVVVSKNEVDIRSKKYTTGDTIGCGVNFLNREVFFTFNGVAADKTLSIINAKYIFATISLHAQNQQITLNFGKQPFKFDIEKYSKSEKFRGIQNIVNQPISYYDAHKIVQEYLWRQGYLDTMTVFTKESQLDHRDTIDEESDMQLEKDEIIFQSPQKLDKRFSEFESPMVFMRKESAFSLPEINEPNNGSELKQRKQSEQILTIQQFDINRKKICQLIVSGKVEEACQILHEEYEEVFVKNSELLGVVNSQMFIEMVGRNEIVEAVNFARSQLMDAKALYRLNMGGKQEAMEMKQLTGLICYSNPRESSLCGLLGVKQRELVADIVNKSLLRMVDCESESSLEKMLRQIIQVNERLKTQESFQGEVFDLKA